MALYVRTLIISDKGDETPVLEREMYHGIPYITAYAIPYGRHTIGIRAKEIDDRYTGERNESYDAMLSSVTWGFKR